MGSLNSQAIPSLLFSAVYSFNCSPLVTPMANVQRKHRLFRLPPPPLPTANDLKLSLSLQQVFGIDDMLM